MAKVTIRCVRCSAPHIIHGISANTMFYLINFKEKFENKAYNYDSPVFLDIPYDRDDFGRIMNAYNAFGWKAEDINRAKVNAKQLKAGKKIEAFLDDFMMLRSLFEDEEFDEFDLALENIKYNKEYQKENDEFTIDTSKLGI